MEIWSHVKEIFRKNKNYEDYFDKNYTNIAIHIRRGNVWDERAFKLDGRTYNQLLEYQKSLYPDLFYLKFIPFLLNHYTNSKIHIFSQDIDINNYEIFKNNDKIIFYLHESIELTFPKMVLADVLVTGPSTFSWSAGLLRESNTIYLPYIHPRFSPWSTIESKIEPFNIIHYCNECGMKAKFSCSRCKKMHYCNVECQKKHWIFHKNMCNLFVRDPEL
jgi:hypothetical protein